MANSRTNELDENFFGDDEELDESDDREETAEEDFSYSNLSASEKKRYDKMKAEIEGAIVSEIARATLIVKSTKAFKECWLEKIKSWQKPAMLWRESLIRLITTRVRRKLTFSKTSCVTFLMTMVEKNMTTV